MAVSLDGETATRDVTATYVSDPCCPGYTFDWNDQVDITFSSPDGGSGDAGVD